MLKSLMTASAVVAMLAAPAVAQSAQSSSPATGGSQIMPQTGTQPMQPSTNGQATPAPSGGSQAAAPSDATKQVATEKFISQQQDGQIMAKDLIGQDVYDGSNNNLGSIADLVLDKDGRLTAVVIGVGGFLGIGQKNVAVSMDSITKSTDKDGKPKLVLNATKEELDTAPQFETLADLASKNSQPAQPMTTGPAGGGAASTPGATTGQ
jgi:sporulation protein YlmC with PRC-barrel domain